MLFWLSWPVMFLYLLRSSRTRILVMCGDEVLVLRGWLGAGSWSLPGGGLHRGENPTTGAIRELMEETGIQVDASQLQHAFTKQIRSRQGFLFTAHCYGLHLDHKPELTRQRHEIAEITWKNWHELAEDKAASTTIHALLTVFYE